MGGLWWSSTWHWSGEKGSSPASAVEGRMNLKSALTIKKVELPSTGWFLPVLYVGRGKDSYSILPSAHCQLWVNLLHCLFFCPTLKRFSCCPHPRPRESNGPNIYFSHIQYQDWSRVQKIQKNKSKKARKKRRNTSIPLLFGLVYIELKQEKKGKKKQEKKGQNREQKNTGRKKVFFGSFSIEFNWMTTCIDNSTTITSSFFLILFFLLTMNWIHQPKRNSTIEEIEQ